MILFVSFWNAIERSLRRSIHRSGCYLTFYSAVYSSLQELWQRPTPVMLLLVTIILIVGLPVLIAILGYNWLKRKGHKKFSFAFLILILGSLSYIIYSAFYPNDSFYVREFESNTNIPFPASGFIINKDATYPDQHGSFTAVAVIRLSTQDYRVVYQKIRTDTVFQVDTGLYHFAGGTSDFFEDKGIAISKINIVLVGLRRAQFKIGFVNDGKTIVFERHSS